MDEPWMSGTVPGARPGTAAPTSDARDAPSVTVDCHRAKGARSGRVAADCCAAGATARLPTASMIRGRFAAPAFTMTTPCSEPRSSRRPLKLRHDKRGAVGPLAERRRGWERSPGRASPPLVQRGRTRTRMEMPRRKAPDSPRSGGRRRGRPATARSADAREHDLGTRHPGR